MKNIKRYIFPLLFCILIQNDAGLVDFLKRLLHSNDDELGLVINDENKSTEEEEKEEGEKESKEKENENKEKEKEKEFKNIKLLHTFVFLTITSNQYIFNHPGDSKLFASDSDTETPPPKQS
ncbi:MAG TPA: hypothetical protein VNB90_11260 [Cytophagaceae bacterium]|nr:hypothetical protein [Cytophagaceae bacterium]